MVRAGMNLDIDAEAMKVAVAAADDINGMLIEAARKKQAGFCSYYVRTELVNDLLPLVKEYITRCLSDSSLWSDWDSEMMREMITPVLGDKVFGTPRYAGFGPKSVTMRFKSSPHLPEFAKLMYALGKRNHEWRMARLGVQS
jgi:hypothetical protein